MNYSPILVVIRPDFTFSGISRDDQENKTKSTLSLDGLMQECAMVSAHSCGITNLAQLSFEGLGTHKVDIYYLCASRGFPFELAHVEGVVETFRRHQFFV